MTRPLLLALAGVLVPGLLLAAAPAPVPASAPAGAAEPALPADIPPGWYAVIETSFGTIAARLLPEQAPQTVAHFAAIAEGRLPWVDPLTGNTKTGFYYDGLEVHNVVAAQRFETGDPTATGKGYPLLYAPPELHGPINFSGPWRMGMTRSSGGKISAVQFFVTAARLPWLNGHHPCFAQVVLGQDVVSRICGVKTQTNGRPMEPIRIERLRIRNVGGMPPLPEPVRFTPKRIDFGVKQD